MAQPNSTLPRNLIAAAVGIVAIVILAMVFWPRVVHAASPMDAGTSTTSLQTRLVDGGVPSNKPSFGSNTDTTGMGGTGATGTTSKIIQKQPADAGR